MVSSFGRGFDSLQLHYVSPSRGLTLVRVLSVAALCESGKADDDSLQLHKPKGICNIVQMPFAFTTTNFTNYAN